MSERLRRILDLHFDADFGSPYWQRRLRAGACPPPDEINSLEDLGRFGAFDLGLLSRHPVEDFSPRAVRARTSLVLAETGGTSGTPASTAYTREDFEEAFITPFLNSVGATPFDEGHWLWLGPGGPHIIGKAAQRIAALTTGSDAFSVDFDPRWFRRLTPGSVARERYLGHVLEQAHRVLAHQDVRYLFSTPVVLQALGEALPDAVRERIRFVYLGGMPVRGGALISLGEYFPNAQFLAGYGNTLFGVLHEATPAPASDAPRTYLPQGDRLIVRVVPAGESSAADRCNQRVAAGARGQVMLHRLDESAFLPCVLERDGAERVACGETQDGLRDPDALQTSRFTPDSGIY